MINKQVICNAPGRLRHPLHGEAQNQIKVLSAMNANSYTAQHHTVQLRY